MEIKNLKKHYEEKMKKKKITNIKDANTMLNFYVDQEKLHNYQVCFSNHLKGFKNKKFISKICRDYYGSYVNTSF